MLGRQEIWTASTASKAPSPGALWTLCLAAVFVCLLHCCHGNADICAPASIGWEAKYIKDIGVCMYLETVGNRGDKYNYNDTVSLCERATLTHKLARLPRINSEQKKVKLVTTLLENAFGYMTLWMDAVCNTTSLSFDWPNGAPVLPRQVCSSTDHRLYFSANMVHYSLESKFEITLSNSSKFIPVCEYEVPQCNPALVTGYNGATMRLSNTPYANQTVRFNCAPGYFRSSEIVLIGDTVDKAATADNNLFYCLFEANSGIGTAAFVQIGSENPLEGCQPSSCQGSQLLNVNITIPDVEDYTAAVNASKRYLFGEKVDLVCTRGYVNATDETLTTASLVCGQSDRNPSLGMWTPANLVVCSAIRCKDPMPFYDPDVMMAYRALDNIKDRTYSSDETNRFPYYPNEVLIRCRQEGNFFMDRTYHKSFRCDLPGNGTNNSAIWFPSGGTVLSSDVMKCQPITCLPKEIVIAAQQNDLYGYLSQSNLNNSLIITVGETVTIVTIKKFTSMTSLDYGAKVRFHCKPEHQMSATTETGQSRLVNSTEVTCASTGTWSFRVSSCIKQTEALEVAGTHSKYVPPAQEAAGASSLGLVVIIILIVFFSTILILDLTTITRDLKLLRTNLRRIKLKIQRRKQS